MRIVEVDQGTPEWFALRRGIPTATDFDSIVTAVKGDLAAASEGLINRLIDQRVRPEYQEEFSGNRHTERGNALEPAARAWYEFVSGQRVTRPGFVTRDDSRAGCSPDGFAWTGTDYATWEICAGLEIKCPDGPTHVGYMRAAVLPSAYKQQVHGSMVITGLRRWDFVSYCPGYPPLLLAVEWDAYTDKVAEALEQFLVKLDAARAGLGLE